MNKKIYMVMAAFVLSSLAIRAAKKVTIEIRNNDSQPRSEVVEIDVAGIYQKLGVNSSSLVVTDGKGSEMPSQQTHDGKLLVDVTVPAAGVLNLKVVKGTPRPCGPWVFGKQYPQRLDDFAWENDKCIYRAYGPALQRKGEKAYGYDVWVKNTAELVLDQRYTAYTEGQEKMRQLRKESGHETEIKQIDHNINFHIDHGNGNDPYKVGPTLGCGVPALMDDGQLAFPWAYKDYQILDNGPLRLTVRFDYPQRKLAGEQAVTEHRLMSIDKGSRFCRQTVWYDGLTCKHQIASGVVIHAEDSTSYQLGKDYVQYADPTDNPKRNKHTKVFVAALFPYGAVKTMYLPGKAKGGATGHVIGVAADYQGERYTYYFGSAWSGCEIKTQEEWKTCITETLQRLKTPLEIRIK